MTISTAHPAVHRSQWPDVEVPRLTLPQFLLGGHATGPAVIDGTNGHALTHDELARRVHRVAAGFVARGLRRGEVVAILAPNGPEWLVAAYGAMTAGGTVSGINPLYTAAEVAGQLRDANARFLVTVPPFLDTARAAAGPATEILLDLEASTEGWSPPPIDPDVDLALLPYSSGTSGLPKGVMLTHRACVANALQQRAAFTVGPDDRMLAVAPFFHAVGLSVVASSALSAGAALVTLPRFDVEAFCEAIQEHRITTTVVVPPIVLALAKHPAVDRYDLSSLRWIGCGAAPLGAGLQEACAGRLGVPVIQGYGMTELTAAVALWPLAEAVAGGSVGKLLPGVRARIVDLATGDDRGPGETGELWVRSPSAMAGYRGNAEATAATVDAEGWLHTGDVARIDDDGALYIVDRVKELIKVKGFQVAPAELEALLRTHPAIAEAAVVGVPDERAGERPKAFVVRAGEITAEDVVAWVAERVAPHKQIREVEFVDAIPTSPAGKTLRRLLRRS